MSSHRSHYGATLPIGWPKSVRSAILHVISMAHVSLTATRSWAANSWNARLRLKAENDRLRQEVSLIQEEIRIKDARMLRIPPHQRPHYPPTERLAILELRAARGWSLTQTARHLLVATATVASWMRRLNEEGPNAIVQTREPVNKFPEYVGYLVRRLKVLCPALGKVKLAQVLGRAGLHLSATTVRRMLLDEAPRPTPSPARVPATVKPAVVTARYPHHVYHCDLTTVPTSLGLWTSWLPFSLPQSWPFCWWVALVVDHYSRRIMGFALYSRQPTSSALRTFLGRIARKVGRAPRYLITDHGVQFTDDAFRRWCRKRGIRQRAVGKYGSIAVIERLIRTVKSECTRRLLIPYSQPLLRSELSLFVTWYNRERPHDFLEGATPDEIYGDTLPRCQEARYEPRRRWPRGAPCAAPAAPVRGRPGQRIELNVTYLRGRKHLPIVALKRVA